MSFLSGLFGSRKYPTDQESDKYLFARWKEAVQNIGHREFPFLDPMYSPMSRVPCRGFVEWIADAWLSGDTNSIAKLFCEIVRANHGVDFGGENLVDIFGKLPSDLQKINLEGTISGLDSKQMATLLSAYMLQATIEGYQEEFILIHSGRDLMAASILPWDFDIPATVVNECIKHVNSFIKRMRRDAPLWEEIPLYNTQDIAAFDEYKLQSLVSLRQQLIPLSVSARMHLLDVIRYCESGVARRSLEDCTFYETRRFGCYTKETCQEIRATDLVTFNISLNLLENRFKKNELQELLTHSGIAFNKTAKRAELFALAKEHAVDKLLALASKKGTFSISKELQEHRENLIAFFKHQASRLGVWTAGVIVPHIKNLQK